MKTCGIEYEVVYSSRKTIGVQVKKDLSVTVRAPYGTKTEAVEKAVAENKAWIEKHREKFSRITEKYPEPDAAEIKELTEKAKKILPEKITYYSRLMGVVPTRITITGAATRFGSCSGKNAVSFSFRLMRYPEEAIDYVVVHELAHIRHHDHSPAFWAEVEKYMPDYKERQKLLK